MVLQLNPAVPMVWRTPHELQFGVARVSVRLEGVTNAAERMLAALTSGVSRPGLSLIGSSAGADEAEIDALLGLLEPVLTRPAEGACPSGEVTRVVVDGDGAAARLLAELLVACGLEDRPKLPVRCAVLIADYVIAPSRYGAWLRRDIPHLPIVFDDEGVRIGPLVGPGRGPCLYCLDLAATDADPAWPAMATQLLGRAAPGHPPLLVAEAVARAARLAVGLVNGEEPGAVSTSIRISAATGEVTTAEHRPHPACGCQALPENVTVLAGRRAARPTPPSSSAGGAWPS